jgi:hypothetical protein
MRSSTEVDANAYGYGIWKDAVTVPGTAAPTPVYMHTGERTGSTALLLHMPSSEQTFAVLANTGPVAKADYLELVGRLAAALRDGSPSLSAATR